MRARVVCTTKSDGDLNVDLVAYDEAEARRRAVVDHPWSWLDQRHGTVVLTVTEAGQHAGSAADALVTTVPRAPVSVWVGDCAPVALIGDDRVVAVAHAGWRGLRDGVLHQAVAAVRAHSVAEISAVIGPHIHSCCYEFGARDLADLSARFGPVVHGRTRDGRDALDVTATVVHVLGEQGVTVSHVGECTGCDGERYWSFRARSEMGRQAMVVWLEPT